jgi:gamma-glutamyltranspeptidase/glutathione hydrolase
MSVTTSPSPAPVTAQRAAGVVCQEPEAAEAARTVLASGGTAVDAAVAGALVQGVVNPQMCGIGGCGVMVVYDAATHATVVLEFYSAAGELARENQWESAFVRQAANKYGYVVDGQVNDCGYESIGTPGAVAGFAFALSRFGRMPWREVLEPAVTIARDGFRVAQYLRDFWSSDYGPDVVPGAARLTWTEESRRLYCRDGLLPEAGTLLKNPDLSGTLQQLADAGPEDFYRGDLAVAIAKDLATNGATITQRDLKTYATRVVSPISTEHGGHSLKSVPPPGGGIFVFEMLNYLEAHASDRDRSSTPDSYLTVLEAMRVATDDRERFVGDPAFIQVPTELLINPQHVSARRPLAGPIVDSPCTTHISVIDAQGNAVALTHTLGLSSGVVTPGLGFTWNNFMNGFDPRPGRPNSIEPGKIRTTMMAPTIGLGTDGTVLAVGAAGGSRIAPSIGQTLFNLLGRGVTAVEAVSAPRMDFQGDEVQVENRMSRQACDELSELGLSVSRRPRSYDPYFGRVQLLAIGPGHADGASDPRGDGGAPLWVAPSCDTPNPRASAETLGWMDARPTTEAPPQRP